MISTHHPTSHGNNDGDHIGYSQGHNYQSTRTSHGHTEGYQSSGQRGAGTANHPNVVAYVSFNSGQEGNPRQGYSSHGSNYNNQIQRYENQGPRFGSQPYSISRYNQAQNYVGQSNGVHGQSSYERIGSQHENLQSTHYNSGYY